MNEFSNALRALRSTPLLTAAAVLSLALGIGANTAVFSLLNAALFRPLPILEPERLVRVASADDTRTTWPQTVWAEIRDRQILDGTFAWFWSRVNTASRGERQLVDSMAVSGDMFSTLGLRPAIGRLLTTADDELESGPDGLAAVISHRFWQRRYGGTADVQGQSIALDGRVFTIVGVTRKEFVGLHIGLPLDVIIPLGRPAASGPYVTVMGRVKLGQTSDLSTAALRAVQASIRDSTNPYTASPYREEYLREPLTVRAAPGGVPFLERRYGQPLRILLGVVALVLLIACGNIAMLLLARTIARRHELGVRAALGATRGRLVLQLAFESLLLSTAATALGMVLALLGAAFVVDSLSTQAYAVFLDLGPDWRVFAFTSAVGLLTACLFGVAPAVRAIRTTAMDALRDRLGTQAGSFVLGNGVVVTQVAISVILVVATGLFVRTFWSLRAIDVGFEPDRVLVTTLEVGRALPADARWHTYERITAAVSALPGVTSAAVSVAMPGGNAALTPWIELSDGTALPQGQSGVYANRVAAGWFQTMGTPVVSGREFAAADRAGAPGVAVVNQVFADRFFKNQNPIGRTVFQRSGPDGPRQPFEIIGVVQNAMYRFIRELPPPTIYTPISQAATVPANVSLSVRWAATSGVPAARDVAASILEVEEDTFLTFRTLADQVGAQYAQERLVARAATVVGALALLLAALGLYGVTGYAVARRRFEIGVRLALGATPERVSRLILRRVMGLVAAGVACGLIGSVASGQFIGSLLYGVEQWDPVVSAGSCTLVIAVAAFAAWLPARRAARVDPARTLKGA